MRMYHRLTQAERYQICILLESKFSIRGIAARIKRSPSTVFRELRKNRSKLGEYKPEIAHKRFKRIRQTIHRPYRIEGELAAQIHQLLNQQWSPEQISGRLRLKGTMVSHETIYKFIYRHPWAYQKCLRLKRPYRRTRALSRLYKNRKKDFQTWIDDRPSIVEKRARIGDYERDTMLGKQGRKDRPVLLTIVDRTSRLTKIGKLEKLTAALTHHETIKLLKGETVHTLTNDNGSEFAEHRLTAKELNAPIFFSRPYASWQRGTNENTNGLIRQYFHKGYDFTTVTEDDVKRVEDLLNTRPRKGLGYKTPIEVHNELTRKRCAK